MTKAELKTVIRTILREELSQHFNLTEAKADTQRLVDFAGEDLANRFLAIKNRLKVPENDLYYWIKNKTVAELEQAVIAAETAKSDSQQAKSVVAQGAQLIGENGIYRVYHITSYEAARKYGANTKWCITGINNYGRKYWDEYTKDHNVQFYFFLPKSSAEIARNLSSPSSAGPYEADPLGPLYLRDTDVDPEAKVKPSMLQFQKYALAVYPGVGYEIFDAEDNAVSNIPSAPYNYNLNASNIPDYGVVLAYCPDCGKMWDWEEDSDMCPDCGTNVGYCADCDLYHGWKPGEKNLCSLCK